jgi:hypothetical protein
MVVARFLRENVFNITSLKIINRLSAPPARRKNYKCYICGQMICSDCKLDFDGKPICKSCAIPLSKVYASICSGSAGALESSRIKIIDTKKEVPGK